MSGFPVGVQKKGKQCLSLANLLAVALSAADLLDNFPSIFRLYVFPTRYWLPIQKPSKCLTMPIYIQLGGMVTCPAPVDLLYSIHLLQQKDYELGCIRGDC